MAGFAQGNLRRVAGRPSLRAALATKQIAATKKKEGLLRGACHRARIRATRSVIASEAKQSIKPQRKFGLLRRFAPSLVSVAKRITAFKIAGFSQFS
jgi:hypothetical protein